MKGVSVRYDAKRRQPWGVFVEVMIGPDRRRAAAFFATEAEARENERVACAEIQRLQEQHRAKSARAAALRPAEAPGPVAAAERFDVMEALWQRLHLDNIEAATQRSYTGSMNNHILPLARDWPMSSDWITSHRCLTLVDTLHDNGCPLPTRRAVMRCLSAFLGWARTRPECRLVTNPALGLGLHLRKASERHQRTAGPNPMTGAQYERVLAWFQTDAPNWYEFMLYLGETGARPGEPCGLKKADCDLDRHKAHVLASWSASERSRQIKKGLEPTGLKDTKTHRQDQVIDLSDRLVDALVALEKRQRAENFRRGRSKPSPFVFTNRDGQPRTTESSLHRTWARAMEALEIRGEGGEPFTVYHLRDTFATRHLMARHDVGWVTRMLGHETEATTRRFYSKWIQLAEDHGYADAFAPKKKGARK